jgi:hypothetical protein
MKKEILQKVSQNIYRRFPELKGRKPRVQRQPNRNTGASNYMLIFRGQVNTADNRILPRWVRVLVNERGKILRITTSR